MAGSRSDVWEGDWFRSGVEDAEGRACGDASLQDRVKGELGTKAKVSDGRMDEGIGDRLPRQATGPSCSPCFCVGSSNPLKRSQTLRRSTMQTL